MNSYIYFTKDFIFFYFSCKRLKNNQKIIFDSLSEIKNDFLTKFKEALIDNFSRAFKLVETIQKNEQTEFEKESIVNINIVEYLVDYIKKISQSFTDLYTEFAFTNDDPYFYSGQDLLINEIQNIFKNEINNNYFIPIYNIIKNLFKSIENKEIKGNREEKSSIQLIYFNNYILYKLFDVFNAFLNSNISYLINKSLLMDIHEKIKNNNTKLFKIYKENLSKIIVFQKLNKNKDYYIDMSKEIINKAYLFFGENNHLNNILYEQYLIENCLYSYFLCTISILFVQSTFDGEILDSILENLINKISSEIIRINHSDVIIEFHEFIKLLSCIESKEKLIEFEPIIGNSKIKKFLFNIKKISFNNEEILKFLDEKNVKAEEFLNSLVIRIMNLLKCNSEEEIDFYFDKKDFIFSNINCIENELLNK